MGKGIENRGSQVHHVKRGDLLAKEHSKEIRNFTSVAMGVLVCKKCGENIILSFELFSKNEELVGNDRYPILELSIKVFKIISTLEAVSFLILLGIAMPLKYIWELPQLVQVVGMAHGVLFLLYIAFAVYVSQLLNWSVKKLFIAVLCSVVPFGPFYVERNYL